MEQQQNMDKIIQSLAEMVVESESTIQMDCMYVFMLISHMKTA